MTKSQFKALLGGVAVVAGAVEAHASLLAKVIPSKYAEWVSFAVVVAGVITALRNQSINRAHVSLPAERAAELGVNVEQHGGKL